MNKGWRRKAAETFAQSIFDLIVAMGGDRSTAYYCQAVWWEAVERGDFGE